jgi:hypothetical protein
MKQQTTDQHHGMNNSQERLHNGLQTAFHRVVQW